MIEKIHMGTVKIEKSKKDRQLGWKERKRQITIHKKYATDAQIPQKNSEVRILQLKNIEECRFITRLNSLVFISKSLSLLGFIGNLSTVQFPLTDKIIENLGITFSKNNYSFISTGKIYWALKFNDSIIIHSKIHFPSALFWKKSFLKKVVLRKSLIYNTNKESILRRIW